MPTYWVMTMLEKGFRELRCDKCGRKLAEYSLKDGEIRIMCRHNYGKGLGPCNRLNVVEVHRSRKNNNIISKDAI